ncbi:hypothetical protein RT41_GL001394 [Lactococcus fujiensis JCM 16395]|uniref:Holliday junction resolvase n=2 Tax=Lactococcus fujiensis TaxID=610251 RepID=A0A2A5RHX3_9LACT|nr:hypothetical protein RT41_GL001394 [Lactococcus fujiensis JCM 16395]
MASPRPKFSTRGGFVKAYMPKAYMDWKKQFLLAWSTYRAEKIEKGKPLFIKVNFYIKPPKNIAIAKKNSLALFNETMPIIVKPDIDNLQKSVLDALNSYAWNDDNQISDIYAKKRYSLKPRIEIEIEELKDECI